LSINSKKSKRQTLFVHSPFSLDCNIIVQTKLAQKYNLKDGSAMTIGSKQVCSPSDDYLLDNICAEGITISKT
jgi:hypothetical protein